MGKTRVGNEPFVAGGNAAPGAPSDAPARGAAASGAAQASAPAPSVAASAAASGAARASAAAAPTLTAVGQTLAEVGSFPEIRALAEALEAGSAQAAHGLGGAVKTLVAAAVHRCRSLPSLYVTCDLEAARRVETDAITWLGADAVALLPPRELSPLGVIAQSGEIQSQRLAVLEALLDQKPLFIVATIEAVMGFCPPPERLRRVSLALGLGDPMEPHELASFLAAAGYERAALVEKPGDFSLRGGIVDVFPPSREEPYRFEFDEDGIGSIRGFSVVTQKSTADLGAARLGPAREWVLEPGEAKELSRVARHDLNQMCRRLEELGRREAAAHLDAKVKADIDALETGAYLEDLDAYVPLLDQGGGGFFDYLPGAAAVFLDEPTRLAEAAKSLEAEHGERFSVLLENGSLLNSQATIGVGFDDVVRRASRHAVIYLTQMLRRVPTPELRNIITIRYQAIPSFHGQWSDFLTEMDRWRKAGDRVLILGSSGESVRGITRSLREAEVFAGPTFGVGPAPAAARAAAPGATSAAPAAAAPVVAPAASAPLAASAPAPPPGPFIPGQVAVDRGVLQEGFYLPHARLRLVTDSLIRGRAPKRRTRRTAAIVGQGAASALASYRDLAIGDYVVHVNHGIGVYLGVKSLEIEGTTRDYIFIKYAGEDRLYVPTDQVRMLQKYVGVEGEEPKLHRLAGTEWARAKAKAKASLQALAIDLLKLYAQRQTLPGHSFSADTPWQGEFESGFRYEETPDQITAVEDIKRDMERPVPMDRLLCGDVGYGKTEVAIRAAFKAVTDGKQVAVLVPTTVLAQQHYATFRERFAGYPVNIDLLSRFRSRSRQQKTIRDLRKGGVDIVIGTHRLLAQDVTFKDLGLLIIDEEHRFGVGHKERLKELKAAVDVLVLTATPIPRTLNMALVGLRDMSVIDTPPEDRYPVQTYVVEYDEDVVRDAILRELARGGQVFYVHNRVQSIDQVAARIHDLLPRARIGVAHGQMKEEELEKVMMDFLEGEFDILVSTTIIESGLDLPNVNTLIVEDADSLGLAQLYQLRGRVGRSSRVAYAYFTYRRGRVISEQAEKRLEAIRDFTELGSGYKVALRDLEIRGAGNLLGAEQHGFIATVGFELYCRMLEDAVRQLKGETVSEPPETVVDVNVDAYLPDSYIPDARQKIETYHRIGAVEDLEEAKELEEELRDRYGRPPAPVANLLLVAKVKAAAAKLGGSAISRQPGGGLSVRFDAPPEDVKQALCALVGRQPGVSVRTAAKALLLGYRPGRRASLGERSKDAGRENVEFLRGLLDLLILVQERLTLARKTGDVPEKGEIAKTGALGRRAGGESH